ncbi:hypothetical protein BC828DRAFT_382177, partial [Blastocladiella britannica]
MKSKYLDQGFLPVVPVVDRVLALAAGSLARGLPCAIASRLMDIAALQSILAVSAPALVPHTIRLGLRLLPHCTLIVAASHGRTDILDLRLRFKLASDDDVVSSALIEASRFGHVAAVRWILENNHSKLDLETVAKAMGAASEHNHVPVLQFWSSRIDLKALLNLHTYLVLFPAATSGSINVIEWWIAASGDPELFTPVAFAKCMARNGQSQALSWWFQHGARGYPNEHPHTWDSGHQGAFIRHASSSLLRSQFNSPFLDTATTELRLRGWDQHYFDWFMMTELSIAGRVADLTWLRRVRGFTHAQLEEMAKTCIRDAAVAALDWWRAVGISPRKFKYVARNAARAGRTDKLNWAEAHGVLPSQKVHQHQYTVFAVCATGHLNVVQWYHRRGMYFSITAEAVRAACASGHVDLLDWIARTPELAFPVAGSGAMDAASAEGRRKVLAWLVRAAHDLPNRVGPLDYSHNAMDTALTVDILDWWLHFSGLPLKYSSEAIRVGSRHHRFEVLDWWKTSGLPLRYTDAVLGSLTAASDVPVLDWWWKSGLPLKIARSVYDERRDVILDLHDGEADPPTVMVHEVVLRWWEEHILSDEGMERVVFVEQHDDQEAVRARWLQRASPPGTWKQIRRAASWIFNSRRSHQ